MRSNRTILFLVLASMLFLGVGVAAFHAQSYPAFSAGEIFCVATSFVWPTLFGLAGLQFAPKSGIQNNAGKLLTATLALSAAVSYIVAWEVVNRATEIIWRNGKFGDPTVSLGLAAAQFFALFVFAHIGISSLLTAKASSGSTASKAGFVSVGMSVGACLVYLALGLSPFAIWRD